MCSYVVPYNLDQRTNTWFFSWFISFSLISQSPFIFFHKIKMLWFQIFLHFVTIRDPCMWRLWIFSYQVRWCTIIGHFQKRFMNLNFNHGRGGPCLLKFLISPLWLWVISIMWITFHGWKKICEKKTKENWTIKTNNYNAKSFNTLKSLKKNN
jgi:hypothetical protein